MPFVDGPADPGFRPNIVEHLPYPRSRGPLDQAAEIGASAAIILLALALIYVLWRGRRQIGEAGLTVAAQALSLWRRGWRIARAVTVEIDRRAGR